MFDPDTFNQFGRKGLEEKNIYDPLGHSGILLRK